MLVLGQSRHSTAHSDWFCSYVNNWIDGIIHPYLDHVLQRNSTWGCGQASVLLQLVLEKVCLAIGGMFMLIGAGLHIAKEVGWLVSKGEITSEGHSVCCTSS